MALLRAWHAPGALRGSVVRQCDTLSMPPKRYIVGSYATSPSGLLGTAFDEEAERAFFAGLAGLPEVGGLELALFPDGALHPHSEDFLLEQLKEHGAGWDVVLTCIPGTMGIMQDGQPHFGLASDNREGRAAAVKFVAAAASSVKRVNAALHFAAFGLEPPSEGTTSGCVQAVELHSAPTQGGEAKTSAASLKASLKELLEEDWSGAQLVVEHCDAFVEAHAPLKGFLSLEEELQAVKFTEQETEWLYGLRGADYPAPGLAINWARSVLETRDVTTPATHIAQVVANHGSLAGLMFSGCADEEAVALAGKPAVAFGAWCDTHMPSSTTVAGSLLTASEVEASLSALEATGAVAKLRYCGVKVTCFHDSTGKDVDLRIRANKDLLQMIQNFDPR